MAATSTPNSSLSLIKQAQVKIELDHNNIDEFKNNFVHTTTLPLSKRFQIIKNVNNPYRLILPYQEEKSTAVEVSGIDTFTQEEIDPLPSKYQQSVVARDLRPIISLKRQLNVMNIEQEIDCNSTKVNSSTVKTLDINDYEEHQTDIINHKLFTNTVDTTDAENIEDCIYIVPDVYIFFWHIYFLKFLLKFGETFHFLILENVVEVIRRTSKSPDVTKRKWAQLAMIFIYQNVKRGFASIVKNPINNDNTVHFTVFECCLKLVEEHEKIILLSNNERLKTYENADRILILTANELKAIVNTLGDANLIRNHLFPNETSQDVSMQHVSDDQKPILSDCDMIKEEIQKQEPTKVSTGVETCNFIEEKNTVDVYVQTDLDSELITRILNMESVKTILADSVKLKEMLRKENCNSFLKSWDINSPKSDTKGNNGSQRNFKWRRKRPRNIVEQKEENQHSLTNDTMLQIPKRIVCSEEEKQLRNKCKSVADDNVPPTDGSFTSGIVSTAPSPNNEYENCLNVLITTIDKEIEKETNNVMFEVTSKAMNENLKSRSDEWVSRFVQIMEEALTQVLQKNPSQSPNVLAPPWTLFEATTCIKMKYRKDRDIIDAGNKLTNTLTKISDKKGTVNIQLTPKQYMEMYSYGVYLIDTLQAALEGCEDLQTASESLSKLLNDIQHPNLSTSQNDAFTDVQDESILNSNNKTNKESKEKPLIRNKKDSPIHQKKKKDFSPVPSPSKRTLRSKFKNESNKVEERVNDDKIIEKAESITSLVSTLDFKNYNDECEKKSVTSYIDEPHSPLYDPPTLHEVRTVKNTSNVSPINNVMSTNSNNDTKQPKIIVNFNQCADYEEKLTIRALELNDDDFEESYLKYNNDNDYTSDDEYNHYESDKEWLNDRKYFAFENIFNNMLLEIRQTFIIVFAFCKTCQKAINISDPDRKLLEVKEVYSKITNICNVLDRIIKRDDKLFVSHIADVLKAEDMMEDFKFDEGDLKKYKEIITKYLEQANSLRECLEKILKHMN
ncbi:hypothetical protein RR46_03298 [Papilio xuthus]|uniref:Uncharacterized protein n=1 Tax=Papilio xuthus TaxID=66420 RepID=A0A194Q3J4_PAPXU|nr:hypothetical protein RR46_03298 [Papilio xuthus]